MPPTRLLVRSAAITGFAELVRALGHDPDALARQAGIPRACLATPDALLPARRAYRLMELAAAATGVDDFGLRMARRRGLSHLGVLGLLARDEPDVRAALRRIIDGLNLHSTCVLMDLAEAHGLAQLTLTMLADGEPVIRQAREAALALLHQILAALLGPAWRPLGVGFVHAAPAGPVQRTHRAMFRCPVRFGEAANTIVLRSDELDRPVPGADAGFRGYAVPPGTALLPVGGPVTPQRLRQTLQALLPQGICDSRAVATRLGLDRRTLHRHLAAHGTDFSRVRDEMRAELARQYLAAERLGVTEIAGLLGFNALSSFSRWFSAQFGVAPTAWRRAASSSCRT